MNTDRMCPRCRAKSLQTWDELSDDEREVVRRLPASADFSEIERRQTHRWCTRCWYESTGDAAHQA